MPSVVLRGSCAAEEIQDGVNGFLCNENQASLYLLLRDLEGKKQLLRKVGKAAENSLYLSWEDSVATAVERYKLISAMSKRGELPDKKTDFGALFSIVSAIQSSNRKVAEWRESRFKWLHSMVNRMNDKNK